MKMCSIFIQKFRCHIKEKAVRGLRTGKIVHDRTDNCMPNPGARFTMWSVSKSHSKSSFFNHLYLYPGKRGPDRS
jgi:hypothetical protein